jgi:ABC transport system ATP-binding/permease protein
VLIDVDRVAASFPTKPLFHDLSFTVSEGDRVGIVGVNGSGKSTLMRMVAGLEPPHDGEVRRRRGLTMATMWQRPDLGSATVREAVGDDWRASASIDRLGLSDVVDRRVDQLSGGQGRRVALAAALVDDNAELLVLDEPTNHLDIDGIDFLEQTMSAFRGGIVLVTHDRHLLDRVGTRVVALSRGGTLVVEGGYQQYLEAQAEADELAAKKESSRQILARQELAWLRRGARARRRKPKARLAIANKTLAAPEQHDDRGEPLALGEFGAARLGKRVIDLDDVSAGHDDGVPLFEHFHLMLEQRARVGIVGPNGAGKSTFLDVLAGRREPLSGTVEVGATVRIGYFDQQGSTLDQQATVEDVVAGVGNRLEHRQVALLERFWFEPATHRAQVSTLSGGEQRRLQLLQLLASEPNVLLLDEPTNDLDLDTLRALESWLDDFPGALVAVTHDRVFLERAIEHVVAIVDGQVQMLGAGEAVWEYARTTATPKAATSGRPKPARSAASGRSASTLRHLIAQVEKELSAAQAERDRLSEQLASTSDHVELAELGTKLSAAEAALAETEERWLELADEAETSE